MDWLAWQLMVYFGGIALMMLLAKLVPYFDKLFVVVVALAMFLFAAFRQGGFDYTEYLAMAELVRLSADASLIESATSFAAKDPVFGLMVHLSGVYGDNLAVVIYEMAFVAVLTKLIFVLSVRENRTLFLGLYAIFLAPGIEFAAMRTGVALGFFVLALRFVPRSGGRIGLFVASVLSHISVAVPVLLATVAGSLSRSRRAVAVFAVSTGSFIGFASLSLLPFARAGDYSDNLGTANAIFFPILSFLIFIFAFPPCVVADDAQRNAGETIKPEYFFNISLLLLAIAMGAALPAVTISVRIMELSWFFTLLTFIHLGFKAKPGRYWGGFFFFLGFLTLMNLFRETWIVFSEFDFFS